MFFKKNSNFILQNLTLKQTTCQVESWTQI